MVLFRHEHKLDEEWNVCLECLCMSKKLTLQVCEAIEKYDDVPELPSAI